MHLASLVLSAIVLCAAATTAAFGEESSGKDVPKPKNEAPQPQHLLGDWGGFRSGLHDDGIDLSAAYTGQGAYNVSGGMDTGAAYAQQLQLGVDIDWKKLAGLNGFSTHAVFINRAGNNVSTDYVGDNLIQAQSIYGGAGDVLVHLVDVYGDLKLAKGRIDIAAGRLPVGEDYATSPLYCQFLNTAVCGYPNAIAAKAGFSTFPNSTWGARVRVATAKHLYVQAGAYEVRPRAGGRSGFDWGWSGTTGTYYPVEVGYEPVFGPNMLEGHYKAGFAHDTSDYPDLYRDQNGDPFAATGLPQLQHGGRDSTYVLADQMIVRNAAGPERGLIVTGGYVWSDKATSQLSRFFFLGLTDKGFLASRPDDVLGIVFAKESISGSVTATQQIQATMNQPLLMDAPGVQSEETVIEAHYDWAAHPGLTLTPDIQYIMHPGGAETYPDAVVIGAQLAADF
ncbi:MAG: hypothetical protein GC155_09920 [Alphaproteobacteria bacterium]|nr:hypothetical protein [Alphaproteobacteria bacterium]